MKNFQAFQANAFECPFLKKIRWMKKYDFAKKKAIIALVQLIAHAVFF